MATKRRINVTGKQQRKIGHKEFASALGAEPCTVDAVRRAAGNIAKMSNEEFAKQQGGSVCPKCGRVFWDFFRHGHCGCETKQPAEKK